MLLLFLISLFLIDMGRVYADRNSLNTDIDQEKYNHRKELKHFQRHCI